MNSHLNLITTYSFRGREYLVNLNSSKLGSGNIELKVTDKKTLEEWLGTYDASYIENLTQKTGNYKRFDTFVSMLKSGLFNTSQCVTLDLLTLEDLEMLRNRVSQSRNYTSYNSHNLGSQGTNRRYLIVTYTVEFDRIHYPLAMEYCGPPDPRLLQETILRLEKQVADLTRQVNGNNNWEDIAAQIDSLQKKVVDVTTENLILKEQLKKLNTSKVNRSRKEVDTLLTSIYNLENKLKNECVNVERLEKENYRLSNQLEESRKNERLLKARVNTFNFDHTLKKNIGLPDHKFLNRFRSSSPNRNRSLERCAEKPFRRPKIGDRKVHSARSSFDIGTGVVGLHSCSEDSLIGGIYDEKLKQNFQVKLTPRAHLSSPSLSDLSHHSGLSRCACRNCLQTKFIRRDNQSGNIKRMPNTKGKAKLMKRIQSLEKLISNIVLN